MGKKAKRCFLIALAVLLLLSSLTGCSKNISIDEARKGVAQVALSARVETYQVSAAGEVQLLDAENGVIIGFGTAFGVGETGKPTDIFVTNRHVVSGSQQVVDTDDEGNSIIEKTIVQNVYLLLDDYSYDSSQGLDTSRAVQCKILHIQDKPGPDIAVLQTAEPVQSRMALPLLDPSGNVSPGDTIYALGFPGSAKFQWHDSEAKLQRYQAGIDSMTVTKGSVTLLTWNTNEKTNVLQHDAQTNAGNSGSPLVTEYGAVVGVHYSSYLTSQTATETVSKESVQAGDLMDILDGLKIPYDVYTPGPPMLIFIIAGAGAAAVAAIILVIVLAARKKKTAAPAQAPLVSQPPVTPAGHAASSGELRLQCLAGTFAGRRFSVNGTVRLGRDPARNDLVFPSNVQGISGAHCTVTQENGGLVLRDLGSTYGTYLGGRKLAPNQPVRLNVGDKFYLASEGQMFQVAAKGGM